MPGFDAPHTRERHGRRLAFLSLLLLVLATMAAAGWRDLEEIRRTRALVAIDVPRGATVDYNGARASFVGLDVIPPTPGVPSDRAFVRTRVALTLQRPGGQHWLACRQQVTDDAGRTWSMIDMVPFPIRRALQRPGEPNGESCGWLALRGPRVGSRHVVDAYFLVPRSALPSLRGTLSADGGRPAYLRFAAVGAR